MDGEFRCYEWKGEPALLNQRVCRLQGFSASLESRFLFYGINKFLKDIEDVTGYTTVKHLSSKSILGIQMPVPPLEEQKRIVALLDDATARISELTACYEQARTHANNLFTSALRDALEGNPDWPVKTLGDVCEVIAGQSPEGKFYNQAGQGTPFYQGKKDFTERFLGSPSTWTTEITKLAQPGDILMSVRAPVGPVNLCPIEACIGRGLAAIRPSKEADTEFIYYYLESIQSEIAGTEGAVFASINKAQIADLRCPVPPLYEQQQIVARLDQMRVKTSEMVAAYDAKLQAAKNLRQSILEAAFAGEL
jgi:type I restriction enzyme S subunit